MNPFLHTLTYTTRTTLPGIDAPICQDTPSGGLDDLLTSAEVGHDALVNLSREEAFQAADDVAFGPASGEASGDVVAGRLVELHPVDDGSIEGRVGVSVAASIEAATDTPTPPFIAPSSSACGTISRPLITSHAARRTAEPSERSSGA